MDLAKSRALFERAQRVIPGGIYGHQNPRYLVPEAYPAFLSESEGCRVRDPDGNEYIDFLCAYGPMVVGYRNRTVEAAAEAQRRLCDAGTLPAPNMVELAERLVALSPGAGWALFAKNGSDVTTWAVALARQAAGRDVIAIAEGTYHGVHGWCNHTRNGFPAGERAAVAGFVWNDLDSLEAVFRKHANKVAGVMITPFRHEAGADSVMPAPGFLEGVRELCTRHGAAMIVDDVRAGFRLHMGGSTQRWGVTPDLLLYSKALANGYPLAAIVGAEAWRKAAEKVFFTGTNFTQAVPIAAALATLEELEGGDGIAEMERLGTRFCKGLRQLAEDAGVAVTVSGPPAIPFMTFDEDRGSFERSKVFAASTIRRGVLLHPLHNWFLSTAHSAKDIDLALAAAGEAFAELRESLRSEV